MLTMTSIFTIAYLLKTIFLVIQGFWLGDIDTDCSKNEYQDDILFLSLLPVFDIIPIVVVLSYHLITLKSAKDYKPEKNIRKEPEYHRLYTIDDLSDTDDRASFQGTNRGSFASNFNA